MGELSGNEVVINRYHITAFMPGRKFVGIVWYDKCTQRYSSSSTICTMFSCGLEKTRLVVM
jgi:hypothetical protein